MKALAVGFLLVTLAIVAAPLAAAEPDVQCMDYYRETHVGPVTIIQRSSCDVEVYFDENGGGILA